MGVNSKAAAKNGTSMTAVVRIRETTIAPNRKLLRVFKVKMEPRRLLMFREWKISTIDRVRNAMVVPSGLLTNSQTPLST